MALQCFALLVFAQICFRASAQDLRVSSPDLDRLQKSLPTLLIEC